MTPGALVLAADGRIHVYIAERMDGLSVTVTRDHGIEVHIGAIGGGVPITVTEDPRPPRQGNGRTRGVCRICGSPHRAHQLCQKHYRMMQRGTLEAAA